MISYDQMKTLPPLKKKKTIKSDDTQKIYNFYYNYLSKKIYMLHIQIQILTCYINYYFTYYTNTVIFMIIFNVTSATLIPKK